MVVGILRLDLRFHDCQSLKAKRGCLKKIINRVNNKFELTIAEVGSQNLWQKTELGIAVIGNDKGVLNQRLDHVINFVEELGTADVLDHHIELMNL
jgi:uncharacterized protein